MKERSAMTTDAGNRRDKAPYGFRHGQGTPSGDQGPRVGRRGRNRGAGEESVNKTLRRVWMRAFGWIHDAVAEVGRHAQEADPRERTAFERRMGRTLRSAFDAAIQRDGFDGFIQRLRVLDGRIMRWWLRSLYAKLPAHAKRIAAEDGRYSLLVILMKRADARARGLGFLAICLHHCHMEHEAAVYEARLHLADAAATRGEQRKRHALEAARTVAEQLYLPYLQVLWTLSLFGGVSPDDEVGVEIPGRRVDGWTPPPDYVGQLVDVLERRLVRYKGLVEPRLAIIRNSVSHGIGPEYDPDQDVLRFDDRKRGPLEITVDDLLAVVESCYSIAGRTLSATIALHLVREMEDSGLLEAQIDGLGHFLSRDPKREMAADRALTEATERMFGPANRYLSTHPRSPDIAKSMRTVNRRTEDWFRKLGGKQAA